VCVCTGNWNLFLLRYSQAAAEISANGCSSAALTRDVTNASPVVAPSVTDKHQETTSSTTVPSSAQQQQQHASDTSTNTGELRPGRLLVLFISRRLFKLVTVTDMS